MKDVEGKVAVVTGGTGGIGLGIAKALLCAGMKVVITYREERRRDEAMAELQGMSGQVEAVRMEVTDRVSVAEAAKEAERRFGKIHLLCNNAGVNVLGPMDKATYEDWDWMLGVNLNGVINCIVTFIPHIKQHKEGGHIVNVASMGAFITGTAAGIYATSKFAVRGLSESLRFNLAAQGIGVSLVCPGLTRSAIFESARKRPASLENTAFPLDDGLIQQMQAVHALGMDPDEVGRRTLEGVLRDDFYIFSHPEFKEELKEIFDETIAQMPEMTEIDPPRLRMEAMRKTAKEEAKAAVHRLRGRMP